MPRTFRTSAQTQGNKASDTSSDLDSILQTCDRIVRLKIPNLLRLYLSPFVAQTCAALNEMVHSLWPVTRSHGAYPSFLANSGEEALSGAIKLARYTQHQRVQKNQLSGDMQECSPRVFLVDDGDWFANFASASIDVSERGGEENKRHVEFIPDVVLLTTGEFLTLCKSAGNLTGILVLSPSATETRASQPGLPEAFRSTIRQFAAGESALLIACIDAQHFPDRLRLEKADLAPDIVVFDETFTKRQVPFGAFASRSDLYAQWTVKGMTTFHSTTYQPNTISTIHFLKCLEEHSPDFFRKLEPLLSSLLVNHDLLRQTFRELFNPALARLIAGAGFDAADVTASGHYVRVGEKRYFDGIGGVACSLRGHNPDSWVSEIEGMQLSRDVRGEVVRRLHSLTGLGHHVPAVSGGSAVEHALKLALIAQSPKTYILALKGGFGGKTLLALSGTSKDSYRKGLDPLYPDVLYVDPFASDAIPQLKRIVETVPVAVIQLELIQGVGGVREIPRDLLDYLQVARQETGVLLFVDEIQTGMFRTGPFVRSSELSFAPDLLTIGKGTSDMMFPFAMTLYSDRVDELLKCRAATFPLQLGERYGYQIGYRSVLNTLERNEVDDTSANVAAAGQMFRSSLKTALKDVGIVEDVRCFGLLIGIELDLRNTVTQRFGLNTAQLYLLKMMQHHRCPLLMGFCQYEPNILKLTPPLTVTSDEVTEITQTISDALRTSWLRLLTTGVRALLRGQK